MSNVWTLLITDDCAEDREIYREYLSSDPHQSYQIFEAASAEVGLALCQKKHCDAILLDFCLPDMTGLEFLDELRRRGLETSLPVIMLTGQGDERIAVQALKQGAQDYLVKQHLQPDVLQLTVRNAIKRSHPHNQLHQPKERQHLTAEIALRMRQSLNLEHILQTTVMEVQQMLECDRVMIYQVSPDAERSCESHASCLTKLCEAGLTSDSPDPVEKFLFFLIENDQSSFGGTSTPEPEKASILVSQSRKKTQESYVLAPILSGEREATGIAVTCHGLPVTSTAWGLLVAYQGSKQRQWQPDEVGFLNELAGHLAIAIQQAEQLAQALTAVENEKQLNAVKSQFVATVAHEYRTPLATILAAASTLKLHSNKLQEFKQQQFLQMIEDKARQMTQLVDDLLIIETFESGKAHFTPLPFELLQFVSDIIEEQRQTIGDRHELTFKITGNTKGFWGDQKLLRQILVNLLSNAIKYSTDDGHVEVHLIGNDAYVIFEVKDAGIGIPSEEQARLFQSFYRGSNVGTIPGTGLGLAIVKICVELHGGRIMVESQEGKGTKMIVQLPKRSI
jgi:signal transduction histidine kinase/DNA-binding response OmpR family regulator